MPTNAHNISMQTNDIPVYIVAFNRLAFLKKQIEYFEKCGLRNLHIIDNASTYPPLLEYLEQTPHTVHRMQQNYGHKVLFKAPEFTDVVNNHYFVLTDPDVIPVEECPTDFMGVFWDILQKKPKAHKVGFSLKIDDLPDHYEHKEQVIDWERDFFIDAEPYHDITIYSASIDTTFALYRPRKQWYHKRHFSPAIRTGYPYEVRHLPWYADLSKPTEEDIYYNSLDKNIGTWNGARSANDLYENQKAGQNATYYYKLFSVLPILREVRNRLQARYFLFGFIPLGKRKLEPTVSSKK